VNLVAERIGDANTSLGLLVIIGLFVLLMFFIYLKGRK
jgi:cbb3-type cytochrome oxidase subunit 3